MYARPGPTTPDEGTAWACAAYRPGKFNALAKDAGRLGAHLLANAFR
jgi:hypothetical protein